MKKLTRRNFILLTSCALMACSTKIAFTHGSHNKISTFLKTLTHGNPIPITQSSALPPLHRSINQLNNWIMAQSLQQLHDSTYIRDHVNQFIEDDLQSEHIHSINGWLLTETELAIGLLSQNQPA